MAKQQYLDDERRKKLQSLISNDVQSGNAKPIQSNPKVKEVQTDSFFDKVKKRANAIMDKTAYFAEEAGTGAADALGGQGKAALIDASYNAEVGKEKTKGQAVLDYAKSAAQLATYAINPTSLFTNQLTDTIFNRKDESAKRIKQIWEDEDRSTFDKILAITQDKALDARDKLPFVQQLNQLEQLYGAFDKNASEKADKALETFAKPFDAMEEYMQDERSRQGNISKFLGGALHSSASSLTNAAIGNATGTGLLPMYTSVYGNDTYEKIREANQAKEEAKKVQYGAGNIDLNNRKVVKNEDGSISTERSFSFYDDNEKKEILIPSVIDGKAPETDENGELTEEAVLKAIDHYYKTGEYLGKFDTPEEANAYGEALHEIQDTKYRDKKDIYSEARGYGNRTGMIEAATEVMSNGLKIFKDIENTGLDNVTQGLIKKGAKKISGKTAQKAFIRVANFLANGLSESTEEVAGDYANVLFDRATIDPNAEYTLEQFWNTVLQTFVSTEISNTANSIATGQTQTNQLYSDFLRDQVLETIDKSDITDEQKKTLKALLENTEEGITEKNIEEKKAEAQELLQSTQQYNQEEQVYQETRDNRVKEDLSKIFNGETKVENLINENAYLLDEEKEELLEDFKKNKNAKETLQKLYDYEDVAMDEETALLKDEVRNSNLTEGQKNKLVESISRDSDFDDVRRMVKDLDRLNQIKNGESAVEKIISQSDITDEQKNELIQNFKNKKIDVTQAISYLSNYESQIENGTQNEENQNIQSTTIENKPLLQQEQQTTQKQPRLLEKATSKQTEDTTENKTFNKEINSEIPKNIETEQGNVDITQDSDYNNLSEEEIENEFRRIQEESQGLSDDEKQLYRDGSRRLDETLRGRLRGVFTRKLESNNSRNGYNARVLKDNKSGNTFDVYENVDGQTFRDIFDVARTYTENGELVDVHNAEDYDKNYNVISKDGLSGYSITPEGDLVSVFNANNKRGWLRSIADDVKSKAKTLDCYASEKQDLQNMYAKIFGFKTASIMDYDMQYDHDNIAEKHNKPQVAFMVNTDQNVETKKFTDYDEAKAYQESFIKNNAEGSGESSFLASKASDPEVQEILNDLQEETAKLQDDEGVPISMIQEDVEQENMRAKDLGLLLNANMQDDLGEIYSLKDNVTKNPRKMTRKEEKEHTTQILKKAPSKVTRRQRTWAVFKAAVFDKGAVFEDMDMRTKDVKNRSAQAAYQRVLDANKDAQYALGNDRYIVSNGDKIKISDSLSSIMNEVGEENRQDFYEYAYHLLNTDRMTLEPRAKERAKKMQAELDDLIKRNEISPVENFDKLKKQAEKTIEYLNNVKNKAVFEKEGEIVTAEESQKIVDEIEKEHPEFKDTIQKVYKFLDANNMHLKNNGVVNQETLDLFKELYPHYVPIIRAGKFVDTIQVPLDSNKTTVNTPIHRAEGGTEDISPLFETIAERTRQTYKAAARNNLGQVIFSKLGNINEISSQIDENINPEDLIKTAGSDDSIQTLIKETKDAAPKLVIFSNGKRIQFDINEDIYDALQAPNELFTKLNETTGSQLLQKASRIRRGLLTEYNPLFLVTNGIKDAQDVLMNSQHAFRTYAKFGEAYAQILKKGYWYQEYMQNGGYNLSLYSNGEFDTKLLEKLNKEKGLGSKIKENIAEANHIVELAPRLAEYIASREMGMSIETAMLDAARVTTNFSAGSDLTKFLNKNGFTFLNANVQGMVQQFRNVREARHKGLKGIASLAFRALAAAAPLALLNGIVWKDDEDYEQLSDYIKDNYYIIGKYSGDHFIRIPKGRVVSTIQKVVGDVYDFSQGNQDVNAENIIDAIYNDFKFAQENIGVGNPAENHLLAPVKQVLTNEAWYGGDIVPSRLQDEDVENIVDESTDKISEFEGKLLGSNKVTSEIAKKLNINPITLNYLKDQYSGVFGDVLLPAITPEVKTNSPNPLLSFAFDKFTTNSTVKNKASTDYYTLKDKLASASGKSNATDEDKVKNQFLNSYNKDMAELYAKKRDIQNSDSDNKYNEVKDVQKQLNDIMNKNMEAVKNAKINDKTATIGDKQYYKDTKGKWNEVEEDKKPSGLSLEKYAKYKNDISDLTDIKRKTENDDKAQLSDKEEAQYLLNSNFSNREKELIYSSIMKKKDTDYQNLKLLSNSMNIDNYLDYKTQEFKNTDDPNSNIVGKTIAGSKEKDIENYLNNSKFNNIEMMYLYGKSYKLSNDEMHTFQKYMDNLGLTDEEKKQIVTKGLASSNITEYEDGTWTWKYKKSKKKK